MNRMQKGCLILCILLLIQAGCYQLFRFDFYYRALLEQSMTRILYGMICFLCAFICLHLLHNQ